MRKLHLAAAIAALALAGPALAQSPAPPMAPAAQPATPSAAPTAVSTTADLAAICLPGTTGVQRLEAIAYCQGYVTAVGQYHATMHPAGGPRRPLFCLPSQGPTVAQSAVAFAEWSRANPQYNNEPALDGLTRWAQATYPCPAPQAQAPARTRTTR